MDWFNPKFDLYFQLVGSGMLSASQHVQGSPLLKPPFACYGTQNIGENNCVHMYGVWLCCITDSIYRLSEVKITSPTSPLTASITVRIQRQFTPSLRGRTARNCRFSNTTRICKIVT